MTSNGETANTKVVDLEKLCNFVVFNFFIWIHLGPQILILIPADYKITPTNIRVKHKGDVGGVVRVATQRSWVRSLVGARARLL